MLGFLHDLLCVLGRFFCRLGGSIRRAFRAETTGGAGIDSLFNLENVIGSNFDDVINGNALDNILDGGAGLDIITGGGGTDTIL